jgi:hypothetical protein
VMRKSSSKLLAAAGLAACLTLGVQGAASAAPAGATGWPTGCTNGKFDNGWEARCTKSNGGHYRANVTCRPEDGGPLVWREATVWKSSGISYVFCPPLTQVLSGGITTKAS